MAEFDVGARLKELRVGAGISQRALAQAANVPHGQISLVETNKISPSVATLRKILGGLSIGLAEFFEPDAAKEGAVFFTSNELLDLTGQLNSDNGDGANIIFRQVGDARAHNLQILHERYAPGADTGAACLEHIAHEGGIVVSGTLSVQVGARTADLKAGDAYLFDSRIPHRFRNTSDEEAVVISACTPPYL